jgi:hypothetical protein
MGFFDRYRQAPPSAFRRMRHDVVLCLADAALAGLWGVSGAVRRMASPPETDRTIALTVADRQVVAHDQDVIALTLVGEHCHAGIQAHTSTFTCPADGCGSTRCAGTPPYRTPTASPSGGSGTAGMMMICISRATEGSHLTFDL